MKLLVDADACPVAVKEILYKTSTRLNLELILVANQFLRTPKSDRISSLIVPEGPDEADNRIVELTESGDLIISADIPLADRVIKKGGAVIDPRGTLMTDSNIGERLATRNLLDELRSTGLETGGPKPYSQKDKQNFANQLDRFLTQVTK